jgi:hypothetical protein
MNQDLSPSKYAKDFMYEGRNMRIGVNDGNTLFTLTTEKGNEKVILEEMHPERTVLLDGSLHGKCIGYCVIDKYIVLFTNSLMKLLDQEVNMNVIYRLEKDERWGEGGVYKMIVGAWMMGDFGWDDAHPIEAIGVYENPDLIKVYWADGKNSLHMINVAVEPEYILPERDIYNVSLPLGLKEEITVVKNNGGGRFHSGTIQYAFSYWNKNGAESALFYISQVYYNSFGSDRAGGPDETCNNSFTITVTGLDSLNMLSVHGFPCPWDFLRVYSIERTTKDTVTNCRVVIDYKVKDLQPTDVISFTDTGLSMGYSFDWNALQFIGADEMTVGTIAIKDNTLFAANIETRDQRSLEAIQEMLMEFPLIFKDEVAPYREYRFDDNLYCYTPYSLEEPLQHWKKGETYRIGLQGQYDNGQWTPPLWIGRDVKIATGYEVAETVENNVRKWRIYYTRVVLDQSNSGYMIEGVNYASQKDYYDYVLKLLREMGIRRVKPLRVELDYSNRSVLSQGVLTGTVASFGGRINNAPFACADWFLRGNRDFVFGNNGETFNESEGPTADSRYSYNWNDLQTIPFSSLGFETNFATGGEVPYRIANTMFWFYEQLLNKTADLTMSGAIPELHDIFDKDINQNHSKYAEIFCMSAPPVFQINGRPNFEFTLHSSYVQSLKFASAGYNLISLDGVPYDNYDQDITGYDLAKFSDNTIANQWFIDSNICGFYSPETVLEEFTRSTCDDASSITLRGIANITGSSDQYRSIFTNGSTYTSFNDVKKRSTTIQRIPTLMDNYDYMHDETTQDYGLWGPKTINTSSRQIDIVNQVYSRFLVSTFSTMIKDWFVTEESVMVGGIEIHKPVLALSDDGMIIIDTNTIDGGGRVTYQPNPQEVFRNSAHGETWEVNFKSSPHLVFSLKTNAWDNPLQPFQPYFATPSIPAVVLSNYQYSSIAPGNHSGIFFWRTPWYRGSDWLPISGVYHGLWNNSANTVLSMDASRSSYYVESSGHTGDNRMLFLRNSWRDSSGALRDSGVPYVWIADLVRDITNQYGSDTSISSMQSLRWIPAGEPVSTEPDSPLAQFTRGDTYIQRFSFLKSYPRSVNNSEQWNRVTQGVSVWIESFIHLDGRSDTHANDTVLAPYTPENWNRQNKAYTQADNFFEYPMVNYELLSNTRLADGFLWSRQKTPGEAIDGYTNLRLLNNFYQVNGELGPINRLITVNNDLIGFQDKGIFNILFNSRVQVPASDGLPIELAQSYKVQGVRYLSTMQGTTNKWSVGQSTKGVYFIDTLNKDICSLSDPILDLSSHFGMKSWGMKAFKTLAPFDLAGHEDGFVTSVDTVNDHVYFGNDEHSLCFNEQLGFFEGFYSYEKCPWRFNFEGDFLTMKVRMMTGEVPLVDLYVDHAGPEGRFFGEYKPSSVTYLLNPDPLMDKVWDTIEYRGHRFTPDGRQLPARTVDWVEVWNDYQHNSLSYAFLLGRGPGLLPSMMHLGHHKFQAWNIPFPRQEGSLNRMRSPWVYLKMTFDNEEGIGRTEMHDMTILYTI